MKKVELKMYYKNGNKIYVNIILIILLMPISVQAYIDPGTWSYVFSLLIGLIAGLSMYLKLSWDKIKVLCKKMFKNGNKL